MTVSNPSQEKMEFRAASIRLFGHLNKASHGDCEDVFLEQVVGGLVPLLLHLQDPQASVVSVSSGQWLGNLVGSWHAWCSVLYPHRLASLPCACAAAT